MPVTNQRLTKADARSWFNQLLEEDEDNQTDGETKEHCLISAVELTSDNTIQLSCGHKFDYVSLLLDLKTNMTIHRSFTIKCPYCRSVQNGVLPFRKDMSPMIVRHINYPPHRCLETHECCRNSECVINATIPLGDERYVCYKHYAGLKREIRKQEVAKMRNERAVRVSKTKGYVCDAILVSGKRKGEACGSKCGESKRCGRHTKKEADKETD
jgi:hypothetical protein